MGLTQKLYSLFNSVSRVLYKIGVTVLVIFLVLVAYTIMPVTLIFLFIYMDGKISLLKKRIERLEGGQ